MGANWRERRFSRPPLYLTLTELTLTPNPNQVDICSQFKHNGKCDYGKECRFAHDLAPTRVSTNSF